MCGRATYKLTWEEIVALYRLTLGTASELQAAMLAAWPTLEVAEPVQAFASWDDAFKWATPRCGTWPVLIPTT
jgi:hypothetical protein